MLDQSSFEGTKVPRVDQASGEVEKADNTENVKEQIVEEGGCTTVLQMTSASNEIANKVSLSCELVKDFPRGCISLFL